MIKKILILISVAFMTACSSLSKEECDTMNWKNAGYMSAIKGQTSVSDLSMYQEQCYKRHGVVPKQQEYANGYSEGLKQYCTDSNLYKVGRDGDDYKGICDRTENKDSVVKKYNEGRVDFLERKVSDLESENSRLKSDISNLESELNNCRSTIH